MVENIFGTDGIRAIVGTFPLTQDGLIKLGHAIGTWAQTRYGHASVVAIAHDTRASAPFIKSALSTGLLLEQAHVTDLGMLPTPVAAFYVKHHEPINCGIIITASHNPHEHNGIKIVDHHGSKISVDDELQISAHMHNQTTAAPACHACGTCHVISDASHAYCNYLHTRFGSTLLKNKLIVLDCAHGATSTIAPHIMRTCGAQVITLHNTPNGKNINHQCGALHPEALQQAVRTHQADAGIAFDGDGDRLVVVNKNGTLLDGDDILALISEHPAYNTTSPLVGTIMSNQGLAKFAQDKNKQFVRTPVGEKQVALRMAQDHALIGAEPSGHVVIFDHLDSSDGIFAALTALESYILNNKEQLEGFVHYPQALCNLAVGCKKDLQSGACAAIIEEAQRTLTDGRIVVRYSGTENLLRIMVEAPEQTCANACAYQLSEKFSKELSAF